MGNTRIVWTEEEEYFFLYCFATSVIDDGDMSLMERAEKAQNMAVSTGKIHPSRMRPIHNASFITAKMREKLHMMRDKVMKDRKQAERDVKNVEPPVDHLHEMAVISIIKLLDDPRVIKALSEKLGIPAIQVAAPAHDPRGQVSDHKDERQRVLIVGLLPAQEESIRKRFDAKFKLKFVNKDRGNHTAAIKATGQSCDHIFCMTKFVDHSTTAACKATAEKANIRYHQLSGVVSDLTRVMHSIIT